MWISFWPIRGPAGRDQLFVHRGWREKKIKRPLQSLFWIDGILFLSSTLSTNPLILQIENLIDSIDTPGPKPLNWNHRKIDLPSPVFKRSLFFPRWPTNQRLIDVTDSILRTEQRRWFSKASIERGTEVLPERIRYLQPNWTPWQEDTDSRWCVRIGAKSISLLSRFSRRRRFCTCFVYLILLSRLSHDKRKSVLSLCFISQGV